MQHFALGQTKAKLGICIFGKIKLEGNNIGIVVNRNIVSWAAHKKTTLNESKSEISTLNEFKTETLVF